MCWDNNTEGFHLYFVAKPKKLKEKTKRFQLILCQECLDIA